MQTKFSKSEMNSQAMEKAKTCSGMSLGFSYGGGHASVDVDECSESSSDTSVGSGKEQSQSTVISIGSKPMKDGLCKAYFPLFLTVYVTEPYVPFSLVRARVQPAADHQL